MSAADTLILLDGTYSISAGTGCINFNGTGSAQPPSGTSKTAMTTVRAQNARSVTVDGTGDYEDYGLFLGRSTRKDSYIKIEGIDFIGGGLLYNSSYDYIKNCSFTGKGFGIGTADHDMGNTYNLIEDVWIWAEDRRIIASNYGANYNVWRRVVVRGDGCDTDSCAGSGNPNVGFTVYDSQHVSVQNVIVIDRILNGGYPYADFATAQHSGGTDIELGDNEWLGCISLASEDNGLNFEGDTTISPTSHLKNCVIANDVDRAGFNMDNQKDSIIENCTVVFKSSVTDSMFRQGSATTSVISRNLIGVGDADRAMVRGGTTSYVNFAGAFSIERYYNTTVSTGDSSVDSGLLYPVRLEGSSPLYGAGYNSENYGATILKRYGADGTFYGDTGYNTLTSTDLWPWPNEDDIKADMAADSTRGFCASGQTLTKYIWEYLGNTIPDDIYGGGSSPSTGFPLGGNSHFHIGGNSSISF